MFSAFEGIRALRAGPEPLDHAIVNYIVLAVAFVLEGTSLLRGLRQTHAEAREEKLPYGRLLQTSDDPTATTVVFEDSAALVGLVVAAGGNLGHQLTGSPVWDGVASLAIAVLLTLQLGADQVLLCARLDVVDELTASQVEEAMVRIGEQARAEFPDVTEVFLEPVPSDDPRVRERVRARYGDEVAERIVREAGE